MTRTPQQVAAPELYWISGSPPSWWVMLVLEAKGIAYVSRRLDSAQAEHKSDSYLAINPRGQVPTLRWGSVVVRESLAILAFIEAQWPQTPLLGRTTAQTAEVWQLIMDFESHLRPAVTGIAQILFRNQYRARQDELEAFTKTADVELGQHDVALRCRDHLCASGLTAGDFVLYTAVRWLERALQKSPGGRDAVAGLSTLLDERPGLAAWGQRVEALPYFESTMPPHWRG